MSVLQYLPTALVFLFFGFLGMVIADSKGRSRLLGFVLGLAALPGWLVLALIPRKRGVGGAPGTPSAARGESA